MAFDADRARAFVTSVDLTGTPRGLVSMGAEADVGEVFDKAKTQAQVVGAGVFSFAQGVTAEVRAAISNSALLAQLVANKKASAESDPIAWFDAYSDVLQTIGWVLHDGGWADYSASGTDVEVNEKIVDVLTVALGAAPAALAIITATIEALKAMSPDNPWITIFSRESQKAKIARFQIGLVDKEENGDVFVSLLGCLIVAKNTITQVLFFKLKQADASFRANNAKVSINRASLTDLGPTIQARVRAYQFDYLSSIKDL
jgi:hypothetical protein